jgi:hypothetical protein
VDRNKNFGKITWIGIVNAASSDYHDEIGVLIDVSHPMGGGLPPVMARKLDF